MIAVSKAGRYRMTAYVGTLLLMICVGCSDPTTTEIETQQSRAAGTAADYRAKYEMVGRSHRAAMTDLMAVLRTFPHSPEVSTPARAASLYEVCVRHVAKLLPKPDMCAAVSSAYVNRPESTITTDMLAATATEDFSVQFYDLSAQINVALDASIGYTDFKSRLFAIQDIAAATLPAWELDPFFAKTSSDLSSAEQWYYSTWADIGVDPPPPGEDLNHVNSIFTLSGSGPTPLASVMMAKAFPWKLIAGADIAGGLNGAKDAYVLTLAGPVTWTTWAAYIASSAIVTSGATAVMVAAANGG